MIDEKLAVWTLCGIDGIGPAGFVHLMEKFGSASIVFETPLDSLIAANINPKIVHKIVSKRDWNKQADLFAATIPSDSDVTILSAQEYPSRLKNISNPPSYFYYKGDLSIFERPTLAVVGSRRPTDYGLRLASRLVGELAAAGVTIVSGLAYGIDGAAHQAALEAGGITAAVFGCGLDTIYPSGHQGLAERIAKSGCLISEFARGTKPEPFNFPVRNRIVAGLSDGVLVIEAGQKSGALLTATIALDQGRDVLAVPGSVDSDLSNGPNSLIKQGAVAVTSANDIFENFGWHKSEMPKKIEIDLSKLSKEENKIFEQVSVQPVHIDELNRKSQLGPGKIAEALLNLELKGFIMRKPGNFIVRA
jgi:DNA processing protein